MKGQSERSPKSVNLARRGALVHFLVPHLKKKTAVRTYSSLEKTKKGRMGKKRILGARLLWYWGKDDKRDK